MRWFSRLRTALRPSLPEVQTFTGNCMVRIYTGDGNGVGPCWHSTYNGVCPNHGDVSEWLPKCYDPRLHSEYRNWPADFQLPKHDGNAWAERMRARQENHKRGNGF